MFGSLWSEPWRHAPRKQKRVHPKVRSEHAEFLRAAESSRLDRISSFSFPEEDASGFVFRDGPPWSEESCRRAGSSNPYRWWEEGDLLDPLPGFSAPEDPLRFSGF